MQRITQELQRRRRRSSAPDLKVSEWLAAEAERIHEKYGIHIARHRTDNKQFRSEILAL